MRRLEGSGWRLRRAREIRLAMEFEWVFFRFLFGAKRECRHFQRCREERQIPPHTWWIVSRAASAAPAASFLSLALIGNASGRTLSRRSASRTEAFSIRRLGGSRWRLRRTRCAMGFERQLAAKSRVGQAPANGRGRVAMVDSAGCACRSVRKQWRGNLSAWGRHTNASMCRSTSQEQ